MAVDNRTTIGPNGMPGQWVSDHVFQTTDGRYWRNPKLSGAPEGKGTTRPGTVDPQGWSESGPPEGFKWWMPLIPIGAAAGGLALSGLAGAGGAGAAGGGAATGAGTAGATTAATAGGGAATALKALQGAGSIASNALAERAAGRAAEADYNLNRDQVATNAALRERDQQLTHGRLQIDQRTAGTDIDSERLRQAIRLGLLGAGMPNIQAPEHIASRMGQISRPGIDNAGQIAAAMQPRILKALMTGEQFDPVELSPLPGLSEVPQSGGTDRFLSGLGLAGTAAGLYNQFRAPQAATMNPPQVSPLVNVNPNRLRFE